MKKRRRESEGLSARGIRAPVVKHVGETLAQLAGSVWTLQGPLDTEVLLCPEFPFVVDRRGVASSEDLGKDTGEASEWDWKIRYGSPNGSAVSSTLIH